MNTYSSVGRPRMPLLIGQQTYVSQAYSRRLKNQLDIAARINVALPRVHRFLVEKGLHKPIRHGAAAHTTAVRVAVGMYIQGDPVKDILEHTGLATSELYKALHNAEIPLRLRKRNGG